MGKRALENRIQELKEIEAQKAALDERAGKLKEEIKTGNFIVRWKQIVSNKFNTKAFQAEQTEKNKGFLPDQSLESLIYTQKFPPMKYNIMDRDFIQEPKFERSFYYGNN